MNAQSLKDTTVAVKSDETMTVPLSSNPADYGADATPEDVASFHALAAVALKIAFPDAEIVIEPSNGNCYHRYQIRAVLEDARAAWESGERATDPDVITAMAATLAKRTVAYREAIKPADDAGTTFAEVPTAGGIIWKPFGQFFGGGGGEPKMHAFRGDAGHPLCMLPDDKTIAAFATYKMDPEKHAHLRRCTQCSVNAMPLGPIGGAK